MDRPCSELRRKAWVQGSCQWSTLEELDPHRSSQTAPCPRATSQASIIDDDVFSEGCCTGKIHSWLLGSCGLESSSENSRHLTPEYILKSGISFEDDLSLGADASALNNVTFGPQEGRIPLLPPPSRVPRHSREHITSTPCQKLPSLNLGDSMASSGFSSSTSKTASSVSEVLKLCSEDAEETLYHLGFGSEEPQVTSRIPPRFFNFPSSLQGINFRVFLECQLQRIREEDPNLSLASRFRQVEVLTAMANAFYSLYSHVSRTPLQKLAPPDLGLSSPSAADGSISRFMGSIRSEPRSPVERLKDTVSKMCLYTGTPRGSDSTSPVPSPRKRSSLPDLVEIVMEKSKTGACRTLNPGGDTSGCPGFDTMPDINSLPNTLTVCEKNLLQEQLPVDISSLGKSDVGFFKNLEQKQLDVDISQLGSSENLYDCRLEHKVDTDISSQTNTDTAYSNMFKLGVLDLDINKVQERETECGYKHEHRKIEHNLVPYQDNDKVCENKLKQRAADMDVSSLKHSDTTYDKELEREQHSDNNRRHSATDLLRDNTKHPSTSSSTSSSLACRTVKSPLSDMDGQYFFSEQEQLSCSPTLNRVGVVGEINRHTDSTPVAKVSYEVLRSKIIESVHKAPYCCQEICNKTSDSQLILKEPCSCQQMNSSTGLTSFLITSGKDKRTSDVTNTYHGLKPQLQGSSGSEIAVSQFEFDCSTSTLTHHLSLPCRITVTGLEGDDVTYGDSPNTPQMGLASCVTVSQLPGMKKTRKYLSPVEPHTSGQGSLYHQQANSFELEEVVSAGEEDLGPSETNKKITVQDKGLVVRWDSMQSDSSGYAEEDVNPTSSCCFSDRPGI